MMTETNRIPFLAVFLALAVITPRTAPGGEAEPTGGGTLDTVVLGDAPSEGAHRVTAERSDVICGGLGKPARRLLPREPVSFEGGAVAFTLKVDPQRQNYVTVKLWGSTIARRTTRCPALPTPRRTSARNGGWTCPRCSATPRSPSVPPSRRWVTTSTSHT